MKKVLITAPYMFRESERSKVEEMLKAHEFDTTFHPVLERMNEADLLKVISDYHGVICGDDQFNARVLDEARNLKTIVKWGTGIDSIDVVEANKRGISVYRSENAFTYPVADTTLSYILAFCRSMPANDSLMKNGQWDKPQGFSLFEKTVGIVGFGDIGKAVAKRLKAFDCEILVNDIVAIDESIANEYGVKSVSFDELIAQSDFITMHTDLNPTSRYLLNQNSFNKMVKRPFIINTSRGGVINEADLVAALNFGLISGAALDVYEVEPLPVDSPLRSMKNTILASHNSNSSPTCWMKVHENSIRMLQLGLGG
ncbi:phosphoglycerate dehydrogenase [Bacteriovorax sp. PP10]|uniref:Phosphoglycerate dehydrogenase n=1 Tax=Bacteriovorax antarcticus TaxID=3088717 RepID=A0ABU5VUG3_9BACT|nr:phosphoglycerate dehydrogenase [Bacteriovorax sp. PP10]MEA9356692.1 phosphoglycerate dehydrogenase [Bacteriovorax sp. PP10]